MIRSTAHRRAFTLIELVVVICIAGVLIGLCLPSSNSKYGGNSSHEFPTPPGTVVDDLKELAGEYYYGNGRGVSCRLAILEDGRFSFVWTGCLGVYDKNQGYVQLREGYLMLSTLKPNDRRGFQGTPTTFLPIKWGRRMYLVPPEKMLDFCDKINSGDEPRKKLQGWFYLREGDCDVKVESLPTMPEPWEKFLLKESVTGKVVRIFDDGKAEVDFGTRVGIYAGMELSVRSDEDFWWLKVVSTKETSCVVALRFPELAREPLRPGLTITSRVLNDE
jgi:prepilin-type N-terminal cleavage/methylation domain-containing protein